MMTDPTVADRLHAALDEYHAISCWSLFNYRERRRVVDNLASKYEIYYAMIIDALYFHNGADAALSHYMRQRLKTGIEMHEYQSLRYEDGVPGRW